MALRLLISGPAGSNKSALARAETNGDPQIVIADFQSIIVSLTGVQRDETGRYPDRAPYAALLPLAEYIRQVTIRQAVDRDLGCIVTNSDGSQERRSMLLERLGTGAIERVVDPGRQVVEARLADALTGELSVECSSAINRWYSRVGT